MIRTIQRKQSTFIYRIFSAFLTVAFVTSSIIPPQRVYAQTPALNLPAPGSLLPVSPAYMPTVIKGIMIDPKKPLQFDFILDSGDSHLEGEEFNDEATKLIKYFLASLTLKEEDMWVNLSPYEKNRMIPESFGQTEMGRDLLAQDYLLKQLTASLMYPEDELGKKFWDRIYKKAQEEYGTTEIPIDTFNKVWIVPESARVFEHEKGAYVVDSHLKVMLEEDYITLQHETSNGDKSLIVDRISLFERQDSSPTTNNEQQTTNEIIREIIIPEIEHEVNDQYF